MNCDVIVNVNLNSCVAQFTYLKMLWQLLKMPLVAVITLCGHKKFFFFKHSSLACNK